MRISEVVVELGMSIDTLRYYEKIKLIPKVQRNGAGVRVYGDKDLSRLRFIKRAQKMGFTLAEIANLLKFRENPQNAKPRVRELARRKLEEIEHHLVELDTLRSELRLLTNLCGASSEGCPILASFDKDESASS